MSNVITHEVARAAISLRWSHPAAPVREILDLCVSGRTGDVAAFGDAIAPTEPFSRMVVEAFDDLVPPAHWLEWSRADSDPLMRQALTIVWQTEVLPRFAAAYGLTCTTATLTPMAGERARRSWRSL